jgi:adenylate cyclase
VPLEIEHKFLVTGDAWRTLVGSGVRYRQGYLAQSEECTVRVRAGGGAGYVTIKGARSGITRSEFEYPIPEAEANEIIDLLCGTRIVHKTRYRVPFGGLVWEVDEFHAANEGLVVAEIELERESQPFEKPPWVGRDVSHNPRYVNAMLALRPYQTWSDQDN